MVRQNWTFTIKGILIFLVVWGHYIAFSDDDSNTNCWSIWIYSFHMPLFIMVSGYFAKRTVAKSIRECMKTRFMRLIVPALLWGILFALVFRHDSNESIIRISYESMRDAWFLYCLFTMYIMANLCWKTKRSYLNAFLLWLFLIAIHPIMPIDTMDHFQIDRQWPMFVFGMFLADKKHTVRFVKFFGGISILLYCLWLSQALLYKRFLLGDVQYIVKFFILYLGAVSFYLIFKYIYSLYTRFEFKGCIVFEFLGKYTIGIYMMNSVMIKFFLILAPEPIKQLPDILNVCTITAMCLMLTLAIRKNKITKKYLLGEIK